MKIYIESQSWFLWCCATQNKNENWLFLISQLIFSSWFLWIFLVSSGVGILVQFIWQHPTSGHLLKSPHLSISKHLHLDWLWLAQNRSNWNLNTSGPISHQHTGECRKIAIFSSPSEEKWNSQSLTDALDGAMDYYTKKITLHFYQEPLKILAFSYLPMISQNQSFLPRHSCLKISSLQQHFTDGI